MGANAQTTVPTFTTSQVLTAAQMNQSARTGVPVFAGTTERDAAFGGSGEKTLAEGQLCYLESTNVVQYYDGAAWATVGPQTASGLVYITGTSVSAVTSFSLPNDTFTSTYRNYRILISGTYSGNGSAVTLRFRTTGTDNSNASYSSTIVQYDTSGNLRGSGAGAATSSSLGTSLTSPSNFGLDIYAPKVATDTLYSGTHNTTVTGYGWGAMGGAFIANTVFDSLSFIVAGGTTFTGVYRVYGYSDS
jgi:hypothetical protein